MRKLLPGLLAIAAIATPLTLAVAPAHAGTAQAAPAPTQTDDASPTPGLDLVETDTAPAGGRGPTTLEESAQDQADASPSTPEPPQESPPISPTRTTASNSGAASAATLAATYSTQILSPVDGANVPGGHVGYAVQVATAGHYWLDLHCEQSFITDEYLSASADGQQFTGSIGPVNAGDNCRLELYGISGTGNDVAYLTVKRPVVVPEVRDPASRPETFYPRVRDGFRDHTAIGFGSRLDSDVTVKVIAGSGSVVRTFIRDGRAWEDYYQRRWVTWNGKNTAGNLVPTGRYTAVITSTIDGRSDTARVPISVASGHRTVQVTRTQDGWYDSRDQTRGNCYAWEVPDGNDLDCWGGRYAQATYRFALPSNARNIDWGVRGYQECCSDGRITKTGQRTSARSFRIVVRVTNWRSFVVRSTWVTYTYRKAI